jgi:hypothetical protein
VITRCTSPSWATPATRPKQYWRRNPAPGILVKPSYDLTNSAPRYMRGSVRGVCGDGYWASIVPDLGFRRSGAGQRAPGLTTSPGNAASVPVERSRSRPSSMAFPKPLLEGALVRLEVLLSGHDPGAMSLVPVSLPSFFLA